MAFLFKNNAGSTLAAGITSGQLTCAVQGGDGAKYPNPSGGDTFRATIVKANGDFEIVDVTARATDTFTIVRNQEGSGAKSFLAGDKIDLRVTEETLADFAQIDAGGLVTNLNADMVDGIDAGTTAAANILLALDGAGKLPADITGDADTVDGIHASAVAAANILLALDGAGKLPADITGNADTATLAALATDADALGAIAASAYARKDVAQSHSGKHTFNNELALDAGYSEDAVALAASGAIAIDTSVATVFYTATLTGAPTFTFTNPAASGRSTSFTLELNNAGSFAPVWPASVDWSGGTVPGWTASGKDIVTFMTRDGGTTWLGFAAGLDMK